MRQIIIFFALVLTLASLTGFAQEQPSPAMAVELKEREDAPAEQSWELYGGTRFASAIVYNNGRVAYKGPVQQVWFGGEKKKSEGAIFFVEAAGSKRLSSRQHYTEGGDELEVKLGLRGERKSYDYEFAGGYRKAFGEEDVLLFDGELGAPIKVFQNASLKPFVRFVGEVPANSESHHRGAVFGGGFNYLQTFPGKKLFVETSVGLLGGTGIEDRHKVLRSDVIVTFGMWKGHDLHTSKFAVAPYVRITGSYFSGGLSIDFGKRK